MKKMRNEQISKILSVIIKSILTSISVILITFIFCGRGFAVLTEGSSIREISISPDGGKIIFDSNIRRNEKWEPTKIHVFELATGKLSVYQPPENEQWSNANYSLSGKQIVFIVTSYDGEKLDRNNSLVAIMDLQGKDVKKIAGSKGYCLHPSFSHSGKKIIYLKAGGINKGSGFFYKDTEDLFDVYEVDIETGVELRLTRNRFRTSSAPYYFPDDETFIFSAYGPPRSYPGIADNDLKAIREKMTEFEKKYGYHLAIDRHPDAYACGEKTYVMHKGGQYISEPYIKTKDDAYKPFIIGEGSRIIFATTVYRDKKFVKQFFEYAKDGNHKPVIYIEEKGLTEGESLVATAISPDGKSIVAVYHLLVCFDEGNKKKCNLMNEIFIYQTKDGTKREIKLPTQSSSILPQGGN
jgi:Tol biopolymer transport system component